MLVSSILVVTGLMCVAKSYLDRAVIPFVTKQGGHKKKDKKAKDGEKKQSTMEILRCVEAWKRAFE